jgi:hypothetical protein
VVDFAMFELNKDRLASLLIPVKRYNLTLTAGGMPHFRTFYQGEACDFGGTVLLLQVRGDLDLDATAERLPVLQLKLAE